MSLEENKNIIRRYQECYNTNNLDGLDEVMSFDVLTPKIMPGFGEGLEGAKAVHQKTLIGMPDFQTVIQDLIAEGDKVVARIIMTGTHTGDFYGIPATGKRVEFSGIYIARIANGKIVEHWGEEDGVSLLTQLGVLNM
ncbi:MAG TPA: ester cyclase [Anaerolineales bacterium]|nr:ester cyclase [Anaerolineales bacterium]